MFRKGKKKKEKELRKEIELEDEEELDDEDEEDDDDDEEEKEEKLPREKGRQLSREEIDDMIAGHIARLTQLHSIARTMV